jgi:hypothetical protein
MPRHFYLRLSTHNFPIACIATEIASTNPPAIEFAVATYNPADEGIIPFTKKEGRARAIGRLNSPKHRIRITLPADTPIDVSKGIPVPVIHAICLDMTQGSWSQAHPAACAAHSAAHAWLLDAANRELKAQGDTIRRQTVEQINAERGPAIANLSIPDSTRDQTVDAMVAVEQLYNQYPDPLQHPTKPEPSHEANRMHDEGCPNHEPVLDDDAVDLDISDAGATAIEEQEFRAQAEPEWSQEYDREEVLDSAEEEYGVEHKASEELLNRLFGPVEAPFQAH